MYDKKLVERFPYIVKWGDLVGSYPYYIQEQLELAHRTQAPRNATYRREGEHPATNGWSTTDQITDDTTRRRLGLEPYTKEVLKLHTLSAKQLDEVCLKLAEWIEDRLNQERSRVMSTPEVAIHYLLATHRREIEALVAKVRHG